MMFTQDGWVGSRVRGRIDGYLFAYGTDYRAALKALYNLSGHSPILPRWALGNWWSRFCELGYFVDLPNVVDAYSDMEYVDLMDRFKKEGLPLSVAVIDTDW